MLRYDSVCSSASWGDILSLMLTLFRVGYLLLGVANLHVGGPIGLNSELALFFI